MIQYHHLHLHKIIKMDQTQTQTKAAKGNKKAGKRAAKSSGDSMKVVYISSPMKVRTSASRFRSLVQELTGKNSDIARYMDVDGGGGANFRDDDGTLLRDHGVMSTSDDTTTSTDSSFLRAEDQFLSSSESFFVDFPSQVDVLGSYHDLLM